MCTAKPKKIQLPEQHLLCSNPDSGCCYVEVKTGIKHWEKCLAVLIREDGEADAKLFVYTYFLKGVGAGKPLIGQIYPLTKPKELKAKKENDGSITITLVTEKRLDLEFKIRGKSVGLWLAAIMGGSLNLISHETHGDPKQLKPKKLDKIENSIEKSDKSKRKEPPEEKSEKSEKKKIDSDPVSEEFKNEDSIEEDKD